MLYVNVSSAESIKLVVNTAHTKLAKKEPRNFYVAVQKIKPKYKSFVNFLSH